MRRSVVLIVVLVAAAIAGCAPGVFVSRRTDPTLYPEPPRDAITFWGHACVYVDLEGFGLVTDPVFEPSYSIFHARKIPAPPRSAYDQADVILISHAHHDHLSPRTLAQFPKGTMVLCPEPAAKHLRGLGLQVRVMRPGDVFPIPYGVITAVPAHHPGGRRSLKARSDGRALGYVIKACGVTVYYSGDTEFFSGMAQIGNVHRPDVAILNMTSHLPPHDALHAVISLNVPNVIPVHTGAYDGPKARTAKKRRDEFIAMLEPIAIDLGVGQSVSLSRFRAGDGPNGAPARPGVRVPHILDRAEPSAP